MVSMRCCMFAIRAGRGKRFLLAAAGGLLLAGLAATALRAQAPTGGRTSTS